MEIIWVPAIYIFENGFKVDFTGFYEVSNYGDIRSVDRIINHPHSGFQTLKSKPLKFFIQKKGYKRTSLSMNGEHFKCLHNRLVMSSFYSEGWFEGAVVNHKDENPSNNFVFINEDGTINLEKSNLEWCTQQDNVNWATAPTRRGEKMENRKDASKEIVRLTTNYSYIDEFPSLGEAERITGIGKSSICFCLKGRYKTAGGFIWMYKDEWEIKKAV